MPVAQVLPEVWQAMDRIATGTSVYCTPTGIKAFDERWSILVPGEPNKTLLDNQ